MTTLVRLLQKYKLSGVEYSAGDYISISDDAVATAMVTAKIADNNANAIARAIAEGEVLRIPENDAITNSIKNYDKLGGIVQIPSLALRPTASDFGVGQCQIVGDSSIWVSNGSIWSDIKNQSNNPTLSKFRNAIARAATGGGIAKIACIGDSITAGEWSDGANPWTNIKVNAFTQRLANVLTGVGITAKSNNFFGDNNRLSIANQTTLDSRFTFGSATVLGGHTSIGSNPFKLPASGTVNSTLFWQPLVPVDTFDIYTVQLAGNGTYNTNFNGGANGTPVSTNVDQAVLKTTRSITLGTNSLHTFWSSGGDVEIIGIDAYNSAVDLVTVWNMGAAGTKPYVWETYSNGYFFKPNLAIQAMQPDLSIIMYGINNWLESDVSTYLIDMQRIITACLASGDVLLVVPPPSITSSASLAMQQQVASMIYQLAATNNCPVLDITSRWVSFSNSSGLYTDASIHPNQKGHYDIGAAIASFITK